MRHRKKSKKFSRSRSQRKTLIKSLLRAVIINERIITTTAKAKYLRSAVDRLITLGKKEGLAQRRRAYRILQDHRLVKKLFGVIVPRFKDVQGGYSRTLRLYRRKGDAAQLALVELTRSTVKEKAKVSGAKEQKPAITSDIVKQPEVKEKKSAKGFLPGVKKVFKKKKGT